jgi:hypothetical protein
MYPLTFQQTPYAMYGSPRSFYGNIQLGSAAEYFQIYGAWPELRPSQKGMLISDWQEPIEVPNYQEEIDNRISLIHALKESIDHEQNLMVKNALREQLRRHREEKENLFRLKAKVEEEEIVFILLH